MDFLKMFSKYELIARVFPSIIVFSPLILSVIIWYPQLISLESSLLFIIMFSGFIFFISKIARHLGYEKQKELLNKWGGFPTEKYLSYSDDTIDDITKARYRKNISNASNIYFPSKEEEENNGIETYKDTYQSAIKWLIENTRKNDILLEDNINYGFTRNMLGLKKLGIIIVFLSLIINFFNIYIEYGLLYLEVPLKIWITLLIIFGVLIGYILYLNEELVRAQSEAYAKSLLRCCENIE